MPLSSHPQSCISKPEANTSHTSRSPDDFLLVLLRQFSSQPSPHTTVGAVLVEHRSGPTAPSSPAPLNLPSTDGTQYCSDHFSVPSPPTTHPLLSMPRQTQCPAVPPCPTRHTVSHHCLSRHLPSTKCYASFDWPWINFILR